ncbi:MAG: LamG domain-containing protein, partial [Ignavibacteria bacterium]|nr:LamG domain-containing protein [Ignavibacteria bacterium]
MMLSVLLPTLSLHSQAPTNGLIAYWPFSGNANDGSGNGHHGTLFGPTLVPDRFGTARSAYFFDGVNDYIQVPHATALNPDSNYTISVWVKFCTSQPQTARDETYVVGKGWGFGSLNHGVALIISQGNKMGMSESGGPFPGRTMIQDGQWHLLSLVIEYFGLPMQPNFYAHFYVDGQLEFSPPLGLAGHNVSTLQAMIFGKNSGNGAHFKGAIDDIRLYNRALSSQEIQSIYTENNWPVSPPPPPVASVSISSTGSLSYCASDPLPVQLRAIGEYDSVVWEPRAGLSSSTIANPVAMPEVTTTYRVRALKFGSNPPCTDTAENVDSIRIEVFESPEADAGPALYPCEGDVVELGGVTRGGSGGYRWEWSPAEGLDDVTLERPHLLVSQSGKYEVIVIDRQGCRDTSSVQITMLSRPRVVIEGSDTMYYCRDGGGLGLVAEGSGGNPPYQYQWSGEGLNRTDSSAVLAVPTKATVYVVEIRDGAGICSGYDSVLVIPTESPIAEAGEGQSLCVGESVKLGDGSGGNLEWEYEWQPRVGLSDGSVAEPEASPISTTVYRVRVRDPKSGCFSEDSVEVRVRDVRVRSTVSVVDYGLLGGCRTDSIRALVLENEGKSSGSITSWRSDVAGVSVLDVGGVLAGESETTVRVRFAPSGSGSYRGILVLYIGPCGDSVEVEVVGSKESSSIGIDVGSVDFGLRPSCVVEEVDTVLVITNSSG